MRIKSFVAVALAAFAPAAVSAGKLEDAVRKGNEAFRQARFDEAMEQYQIAETERPESPELDYNIAGALYQQQKYEEATERYTRALNSDDVGLTADAQFNLGNTHFRAGDFANAIKSYEEVLKLRPDDMDAKFNLELARRRLKDQMQAQPQDQQKQQQQQQQQKQDQQQNQQEQPQNQEEQQQQQQQPQEQQQQQAQEKPMSKEDAERILNALRDEQDIQKNIKREVIGGDYIGKDW